MPQTHLLEGASLNQAKAQLRTDQQPQRVHCDAGWRRLPCDHDENDDDHDCHADYININGQAKRRKLASSDGPKLSLLQVNLARSPANAHQVMITNRRFLFSHPSHLKVEGKDLRNRKTSCNQLTLIGGGLRRSCKSRCRARVTTLGHRCATLPTALDNDNDEDNDNVSLSQLSQDRGSPFAVRTARLDWDHRRRGHARASCNQPCHRDSPLHPHLHPNQQHEESNHYRNRGRKGLHLPGTRYIDGTTGSIRSADRRMTKRHQEPARLASGKIFLLILIACQLYFDDELSSAKLAENSFHSLETASTLRDRSGGLQIGPTNSRHQLAMAASRPTSWLPLLLAEAFNQDDLSGAATKEVANTEAGSALEAEMKARVEANTTLTTTTAVTMLDPNRTSTSSDNDKTMQRQIQTSRLDAARSNNSHEATSTAAPTTTTSSSTTMTTTSSQVQLATYNNNNKQPTGPIGVLCNSRCNCLLLEQANSTTRRPPSAISLAKQPDAPPIRDVGFKPEVMSPEAELVAFSEDYTLDESSEEPIETHTTNLSQDSTRDSFVQRNLSVNGTQSEQLADPQSTLRFQKMQQPKALNATKRLGGTSLEALEVSALDSAKRLHHPHPASEAQLLAQSLYSSQAPKLSFHSRSAGSYLNTKSLIATGSDATSVPSSSGSSPTAAFQVVNQQAKFRNQQQQQLNPVKASRPKGPSSFLQQHLRHLGEGHRLVALRGCDLSGKLLFAGRNLNSSEPHLGSGLNATDLAQIIAKLKIDQIESLVLRNNEFQFETWSELYALLSVYLRPQLFHLDLSHNSLGKLGITFTGYIEHHLAASHGEWPFGGVPAQPQSQQNKSAGLMEENSLAPSARNSPQERHLLAKLATAARSSSLNGSGKLYIEVRDKLRSLGVTSVTNATSPGSHPNSSPNQLHLHAMQIRALDLSHNKLKWLINDQFRALKHIQAIRLDHNKIRFIHQHAFTGLESLRFLNLNFNRLQVIYVEQFQSNYNLMALMLRSNSIAYLRGGSFASLANLKRLDLSQNKLSVISNNAFIGLESLELLNLSSNLFVHTPSASLHPITNLRLLDLSANLINQLAPGTFFHLALEELRLNENDQLVEIDRCAFWDLPYLTRLQLNSNQMLLNINSQAFIGTPALQSIQVSDSSSLSADSRQLLENITQAATYRLLRQATAQPVTIIPNNQSQPAHVTTGGNVTELTLLQTANSTAIASAYRYAPSSAPFETKTSELIQLAYGSVCLLSLVFVLKVLLKFTSTNRYLRLLRQRRRVYEAQEAEGTQTPARIVSSSGGSEVENSGHVSSSSEFEQATALELQELPTLSLRLRSSSGENFNTEQMNSVENVALQSEDKLQDCGSFHEVDLGNEQASCSTSQQQIGCACCEACNSVSCGEIEAQQEIDWRATVNTGPPARSSTELEEEPRARSEDGSVGSSQQLNELIQSQLVAAGLDYGHANCAHFYQSLAPALQMADLTANFVNHLDHYY